MGDATSHQSDKHTQKWGDAMSKQALYYYAENLAMIKRATFTTAQGKVSGIGENGRDLLVFLCNAANEKQGWCFHMGYQYIAEETDIHPSTVKRLMAGFEQLGWITRTGELIRHHGRGAATVEYALTFYPQCAELMRTGRSTSRSTGRSRATENSEKHYETKDNAKKECVETEPEPKTQPETQRTDRAAHRGREKEHQNRSREVLDLAVGLDLLNYPPIEPAGQGLMVYLKNDYRPLVTYGLEMYPDATPKDLAQWCLNERRELDQPGELLANLDPHYCHNCNSTGKVYRGYVEKEIPHIGVYQMPLEEPCPVCSDDTRQQDRPRQPDIEPKADHYTLTQVMHDASQRFTMPKEQGTRAI